MMNWFEKDLDVLIIKLKIVLKKGIGFYCFIR